MLTDKIVFMPENNLMQRVFGIETEYSCMITSPDDVTYEIVGSCHSVDSSLELYQEPNSSSNVISYKQHYQALRNIGLIADSSGMLSNGGRFYYDPSGPEYDTPETTSAEEAVHRSFDGDEIIFRSLLNMHNDDLLNSFQLNRKIVDHNRTSRGIHLNHSFENEKDDPEFEIIQTLATLNIVKGAIFGSGGLLLDKKGDTHFHHSPRLAITTDLYAQYSNYKKRPLVRKPFKKDLDCLRVETVTSDALNFAWPLRASMVITSAVLRLIETKNIKMIPKLTFGHIDFAHSVGRLGHEAGPMLVENNNSKRKMYPLDIITDISEIALGSLAKIYMLDEETEQVLREIIDIADLIKSDPEKASPQVESIARYNSMRKKMEKEKVDINSETICRFDYAWDWIGGGYAETLRKKSSNALGWHGFKSKFSQTETNHRILNPPKDTRAFLRASVIRDSDGSEDTSWDAFKVGKSEENIHPLRTTI